MSEITIPTKLHVYNETDILFWQKFGPNSETNVSYNCVYIGTGETDNGDKWKHDIYVVIFTKGTHRERFEFRSGIGNRFMINKHVRHTVNSIRTDEELLRKKYTKLIRTEAELCGAPMVAFIPAGKVEGVYEHAYVRAFPCMASVLYCLLSDASLGDMTFEDHCSDLGYDTDSRKVLAEYLECQNTNTKLRNIFGSKVMEEMREALEDY